MVPKHAPQPDDVQGWRTLINRHTGERLQCRRVVRDTCGVWS